MAPKSSASPIRISSAAAPYSEVTRFVRWRPGCTELTVTPSSATSRAIVLRNPVAPARAVLERISWGIGWRTATEVIATTRPHPCACIGGTAALHIATTDIKLRSMAAG